MRFNPTNHNLTEFEIRKLTEEEQRIIREFKKTTRLPFYRNDIIYLKKMVMTAMPEQICSVIKTAQRTKEKQISEGKESNFIDFKYLYHWVLNMNLRKKVGTKND